jgi:polysaccharide deacetylase 2 family uncharacterized protein YibQ
MARRAGRTAKGKRARRKRPKSRKRKDSFWFGAGLVLIVAVAALGVWLVTSPRPRQPAHPAYEENHAGEFTTLVREVELSIYESLRQLGIPPAQVQFRKVVHRSREERQWDYAQIEVQLREGQSLARAEEVVSRNLKALPGDVRWEASRRNASRLEARITVQGMLTHRLDFFREEVQRQAQQPAKPRPPRPKVAIVIDDLGYDGRLARRFLALQRPVSFAVLPHAAFSASVAREAHEAGHEVLLHLPMEPKGYPGVNPGEGTLLVAMSDGVLVETLRQDLSAFPFIIGVNNHMGSRFSEDEEKMRVVLGELKQRGLFFLDSRTSAETKGYSLAIQMGIPAAERDVFLDNIQSPQAIRSEFRRLVNLARLKGRAVGIAHPHEATLGVFGQVLSRLGQEGIDLVPISELLQR